MTKARPMGRMSLRTTGGFAHFPRAAEARTVGFGDLTDDEAAAVAAAIDRAMFFERPDPVQPESFRDARTYHVEIEMNGRSRALAIYEPIGDEQLGELIRTLRYLTIRD